MYTHAHTRHTCVLLATTLLLSLAACATERQDSGADGDGSGGQAPAPNVFPDNERGTLDTPAPAGPSVTELYDPAAERGRFIVHEWGTFTSMQGSDGLNLEGLHHEEEGLPPFVYRRDIASPFGKSIESLPEGVTQKLETPVIYFYGEVPRAKVDVAFPDGVISEWFPNASSFAPAIGEVTRIGDGAMTWDVALSNASPDMPWVPAEDIWAPSREVPAANAVSVGGEHEKFIFYRGLGRFDVPLQVTSASGVMEVRNNSDQPILEAFVLNVGASGASVHSIGGIGARGAVVASPSPKERAIDDYVVEASDLLTAALIESGLYADEAIGMVDTWSRSYFRTPGLRVLYVVPREWTDALLPITVDPAPDELVRTLVGRVEVLLDTEEQALVAQLEATDPADIHVFMEESVGRFAEPKLRRIHGLLETDEARARCASLISVAGNGP